MTLTTMLIAAARRVRYGTPIGKRAMTLTLTLTLTPMLMLMLMLIAAAARRYTHPKRECRRQVRRSEARNADKHKRKGGRLWRSQSN